MLRNLQSHISKNTWNQINSKLTKRSLASVAGTELGDLSRIVAAYRHVGHLKASLDPLGLHQHRIDPKTFATLEPTAYPSLANVDLHSLKLDRAETLAIGIPDGLVPDASNTVSAAEILQKLEATYCGKISAEYSHCESQTERDWWTLHLEAALGGANKNVLNHGSQQGEITVAATKASAERFANFKLTPAEQRNAHTLMTMAERFELFLARKYETLKRYSGEGAESMIPALDTIFASAASSGVSNVVVGMPHRGRLSFLVSLMEYPARKLFHKLKGRTDIPAEIDGLDDVSSHVACSTDRVYNGKNVHVSLLHNPSHLEAINPVAVGKTRAKNDGGENSMCIQVHGDAAFSGQGVVPETLAMAALPGYNADGSVHIVVNNQLGFTAGFGVGRTSAYCTDIAKGSGIPIIHVNAESVQEVMLASRLAVAYRQQFKRDVVIDLVAYRKHGHNELDEPAFTQPLMYQNIRSRDTYPTQYSKSLLSNGLLKQDMADKLISRLDNYLETELKECANYTNSTGSMAEAAQNIIDAMKSDSTIPSSDEQNRAVKGEFSAFRGNWSGLRMPTINEFSASGLVPHRNSDPLYNGASETKLSSTVSDSWAFSTDYPYATGIDVDTLREIGKASVTVPENFTMHPRLSRTWAQDRLRRLGVVKEDAKRKRLLDWATAESLAFGTLLMEGRNVRLSGQDSQRGTFSHRHAVLHDQNSSETYTPLNHLETHISDKTTKPGQLHVYSSHLSEFAVMGFEYGYSLENPNTLSLWEAQFGDFGNGAQIIIDQFLSSSETKWLRPTGLVLLLPHGFDGAGPEHSSCRIERYLQLCNSHALANDPEAFQDFLSMSSTSDVGWGTNAKGIDKALTEAANMSVVVPSTPAQYFHLLRRQMERPFRKPMVVVAPKTLLRHPQATSDLEELGPDTQFQPVIGDKHAEQQPESVKRVIFCSGKLYYDLLAARDKVEQNENGPSTALIRIEELCPFPAAAVAQQLSKYGTNKACNGDNGLQLVWAQEEPVNAGAWSWIHPHFLAPLMEAKLWTKGEQNPLMFAGRPALAASAVGTGTHNKLQSNNLMVQLFGPEAIAE